MMIRRTRDFRVHSPPPGSTLDVHPATPHARPGAPRLEGISDIRIVGIDKNRPPLIRKEPYIDLFFRLSHKAPQDWCEEFNKLIKDMVPQVKIDKTEGLYINAYVRDMNQIPGHLEKIKEKISACNEQYIDNIRQKEVDAAAKNASLVAAAGEQARLNAIIAALKFDE